MKRRALLSVFTLGAGVLATAPVLAQVIVQYPPIPGPMREGPPPPPPGPPGRFVWERGHWHWNGRGYVWLAGHWIERAPRHAYFVEGHWARSPGGYVWVPAHWQ